MESFADDLIINIGCQIILVITTLLSFSYLTTLASIPSDINDEGFRCPCYFSDINTTMSTVLPETRYLL